MKLSLRSLLGAIAWLTSSTVVSVAQTPSEPAPAPGQPTETLDPAAGDVDELRASKSPWRLELTTWIWLMGVEGDVGVRGVTADVSADFGDIVDASDSILAFSGRLELGYGPVAAFADGFYSDLGVDNVSGPLGFADIDLEFEQAILDLGLVYRLFDSEPSGRAAKNHRNLSVDAYAGARYSDVEVELKPKLAADRSGEEDWFDPIVGAKAVVPIAEHWHLGINGDVGGFGAESDFTWSATGVVGFDFHLFKIPASLLAGYRAIGWDFSDGSGNEKFTWDVVQHGALFGFSLRF